jgi:hypothetical protein
MSSWYTTPVTVGVNPSKSKQVIALEYPFAPAVPASRRKLSISVNKNKDLLAFFITAAQSFPGILPSRPLSAGRLLKN